MRAGHVVHTSMTHAVAVPKRAILAGWGCGMRAVPGRDVFDQPGRGDGGSVVHGSGYVCLNM